MSRDPDWKVGATLVAADNRKVSFGYNGLVRGVPETPENWAKPRKLDLVRHAEQNAMAWASFPLEGSTLYVPLRPCFKCLGEAVNNGVHRVVWFARAETAGDKWYGDVWDEFASHIETCEIHIDVQTQLLINIYS